LTQVNSRNNDRETRTVMNEQDVLDFLPSATVRFMTSVPMVLITSEQSSCKVEGVT